MKSGPRHIPSVIQSDTGSSWAACSLALRGCCGWKVPGLASATAIGCQNLQRSIDLWVRHMPATVDIGDFPDYLALPVPELQMLGNVRYKYGPNPWALASFIFCFLLFSDALLRVYVVMDSDARKCPAEQQQRLLFRTRQWWSIPSTMVGVQLTCRTLYAQSPVIPRGLTYAPPILHVTSFLAAEFLATEHSASLDLAPETICHRNCMPSLILNFLRNCSRPTILRWLLRNSHNALADNFIVSRAIEPSF